MRQGLRQSLHLCQARVTGRAVALGALIAVATACGDDADREGSGELVVPDGMTTDAGDTRPRLDGATMSRADPDLDAGSMRTDGATATAATSIPDASGPSRDPGASTAVTRGAELAKKKECSSCHQDSFAGSGFFPNISPDMTTGIGGWSDREIGSAITNGVGRDGGPLCTLMMRYAFTAGELSDLIAFLRSVPPKSKRVTEACTGR